MQYNKNRYNEYRLRKNAFGNLFKGSVDFTKAGIALLHGLSLALRRAMRFPEHRPHRIL